MREAVFDVAIILRLEPAHVAWAQDCWRPVAALLLRDEVQPQLSGSELRTAGSATLRLYPGDASHYRDNVVSSQPLLWVALNEKGALRHISADPYEGEAMAETASHLVETVSMPEPLIAAVKDFVALHYVERPFVKRKRDRMGQREQGRE